MMQQYLKIKEQHKDCILFFRLGDFYEMFFDDALTASKVLEITLTGRDCGQTERAPMCGVPYHAADAYVAKLIEKGYKVAICEQVEDPSPNSIVKREVVRIITPGTVTDQHLLDEKQNNYLCTVCYVKSEAAIAYVDVSTGSIYCTLIKNVLQDKLLLELYNEISKIHPAELISNKDLKSIFEAYHINISGVALNKLQINESNDIDYYISLIKDHFKVISLEALGIYPTDKTLIFAIGKLVDYLLETQKTSLTHINHLKRYHIEEFMIIDDSTRKNLELTEPIRGTDHKNTLFNIIDYTKTAMGARKLKRWLLEPLQHIPDIIDRQDAVEWLYNHVTQSNDLAVHLRNVYDMERLLSRIVYGNCNGRDLNALKQSLAAIPDIVSDISILKCNIFEDISSKIDLLRDVYDLIHLSIVENPPTGIKEGNIIREGYHPELDELRHITTHGKDWISQLIEEERAKTGIKNLKIGFNKVFGYYIEVTKSYIKLVPDDYIRKQTLANAERYITPELKDMEVKILNAESKIEKLEYDIFNSIRQFINNQVIRIQDTADKIASIDAINSMCIVALKNKYTRPSINEKGIMNILNGRHPVVEKVIQGSSFIENSTFLDNEKNRFSIITGPNMAGKSTYLRQVALICILGHMGSFVPCEKADLCLTDKVFSRVGASDDLSGGQSTFMVEMSEVSNIIKNATCNSLIILDEIGRGTSTYDGLSIAWSVTEYIVKNLKSKTLFATHYHELSELEGKIEGINNYKIQIKESGEDIVFLRKIARGSIDKSYGIHVAKLAGLPTDIIKRSFDILRHLEEKDLNKSSASVYAPTEKLNTQESFQIAFWQQNNIFKDFIAEHILNINIDNLTPLQSMNILNELINKSRELGD